MKFKRYIFPVLMGATMSIVMSLLNLGRIVFPSILATMLLQATVASLASLIFPAGPKGAKLAEKLFQSRSYVLSLLVSSILPAIYFTLILSVSGLLRMKGYSDVFWQIYLDAVPRNMLFGYGISLVWNVILDKTLTWKENIHAREHRKTRKPAVEEFATRA